MTATLIDRRKALTVVAAAPAAIALGTSAAHAKDDPLLPLIRRFQKAEAALNASSPLSDEECDAWTDANNKLLSATFMVPALTAESAVAALDVVLGAHARGMRELHPEDFDDCLISLLIAARDYLASAAKRPMV